MKRALISVSNKDGVVEFAKGLAELGYQIVSTGGTFKTIQGAGIPVTYVTQITGFPEILDGRVKTLHPRVHGGILARRTEEHLAQLQEHDITPIDVVAVNLYPFQKTVANADVTYEEAIENIDIGGPAMVRAAAKNHQYVAVVVNPARYDNILSELREKGQISLETRKNLAKEAFAHTADYDLAIATYLTQVLCEDSGEKIVRVKEPNMITLEIVKAQDLRYGENPHQKASFYRETNNNTAGAGTARQLWGKELSFNNLMDLHAAIEIAREFTQPAATIIKHTNPCGTAVDATLAKAYRMAFDADPTSAFGGIIGLNNIVDEETASQIVETFMEAVIAPGYSPEALNVLKTKADLRIMETGPLSETTAQDKDVKKIRGGYLVQDVDMGKVTAEEVQVVTERQPTPEELEDLLFAWQVVKHVKSNAIVVASQGVTLGVGAGQMNRVGAARIALEQSGEKAQGSVLASDAFFPFADTIDLAAKYGVKAIIQPGGSKKDDESIAACNRLGIAMVFTAMRHFKH